MFNLPTYRITPSAHPVKCPLSARHPFTPNPCPPPLPPPLVHFPELGVFTFCHLSDISHIFLLHSLIFLFTIIYINALNDNIRLSFSDWLTLLSIIPSSSIHVEANGGYLSFLMAEEYSIVYINHIFFIHSSFDGHRGSFHSLAIVDNAARNIGVQVSWRFIASESLG